MSTDDELSQAQFELQRMQEEAEQALAEVEGPGGALVHVQSDPVALKRQMASRRSDLARLQEGVLSQQKRVRDLVQRKKEELDRAMRAMEMELAPMREQVALLEEGIQTVNLYLGRDEAFEVLASGEPCPATEPIVVRQMTLYMDEEVAVVDEEDGDGIHANRVGWFDEWLLADPAHLDQVLPERKGIVALEPRRHLRRERSQSSVYDDQTYWLIRNGDNVYRMLTDASTFSDKSGFRVGERIVPEREEFTSFFQIERSEWVGAERRTWTEPMKPGTDEWLKAEKRAGKQQRHYMKIALVLQGLVDRTTVFHPLPPEGVSFLGPQSYDAGHIRIVTDAELALGTGLEPFYSWLRRLNAGLKVGMRIVGHFNGYNLERSERGWDHYRLSPTSASLPLVNAVHVLEERKGSGSFTFRYKRTDKRYGWEFPNERWYKGRYGEWEYKQRASCRIEVTDRFIIPFDLVTIEELERYLAARTERHQYADMFPAIKECITAKKEEREAEAPMRSMLAGVISTETGVSIPEVEEMLPELVDWYKLKNRWHRPLVTEDQAELAKATRMILSEFKARIAARGNEVEEEAQVSKLRLAYPGALVIGRRKDGTYVTIVPELEGTPWVAEYRTSATGRSTKEVKRWSIIPSGWRSWRLLYASPAWKGWDLDATDRTLLRPDEVEAAVEEVVEHYRNFSYSRFKDERDRTEYRAHSVFVETPRGHPPIFRVEMYECPIVASVPDLLLTGSLVAPGEHYAEVGWERTSAGKVNLIFQDWRFHAFHRDRHDRDREPVWTDTELRDEFEAEMAKVDEALALQRVMQEKVNRGVASIKKQWNDFAYAATYARFLEDFMDPELWEGHLKHTKIPKYPHEDGRYFSHDDYSQPEGLLRSLIEQGVDPHGLTVQETVDLHRSTIGSWEEPGGWRETGHGSRTWEDDLTHTVDHAAGVPDDILSMTISTEPEA